jgi:hypothetical protein
MLFAQHSDKIVCFLAIDGRRSKGQKFAALHV